MESSASFGDWLRRRRKALDMTQDALAEQVGCSVGLIRKIESDERRPSRQIAELLANILQIPASEREKFVKVARAQLQTERLESVASIQTTEPTLPVSQVDQAPVLPPTVQSDVDSKSTPLRLQLSIPPTPLIGRESEVGEVAHLLATGQCRMLTLTGPGGIGKTRLALAVAAKQQTHFAQGTVFVGLAALTSPEFIVSAIANALGFAFASGADPKAQLIAYLRSRQILLILDNFEHLLDSADLVSNLAGECPQLKLLITSRERLDLQGEWVFDLQGLPLPTSERLNQTIGNSAVQLFITSAQRVHSAFRMDEENVAAIAAICRLVEGMPLAIELAASWVYILSCQEIADEIRSNVDFLTVERRDLPQRQRSLRATFDHSWRLLSEPERQLLCRLVIFQDGFTREAASVVAGATLPLLSTLIAKSLLRRREDRRYDLHELIRQFALEKLQSIGAWAATREQHLNYFLQFAQEAREQLRGPNLTEWYSRLGKEHANLRAALEWALATPAPPDRIERGIRLATANHRYWQGRGHLGEGFAWLERGLQTNAPIDPATRAEALQVAGWLLHQLGNSDRARLMLSESIALFKQFQDDVNTAAALDFLGDVSWMSGDFLAAQNSYAESLAIFRRGGDRYQIGLSLYSAGRLHVDYGYYREAKALLDEGLKLLEAIPHARGIALCQNALGRLALFQEQWSQAALHLRTAIQIFYELGNKVDIAECLEAFTLLALAANQNEQATWLWSAASTLRQRLGVSLSVYDPIYQKVATTEVPNHLATSSAPNVETMTAKELADFVTIKE